MIEFLSALFPAIGFGKEYVELRMLDPQGKYHAMQDWLDNLNKVEDTALREAQFRDVYFGVLPRVILKGGAEAIDDYTSVLWGDYDPKVLTKPGLFATITGLSPKPQIVVDSGTGYHTYHLLDRSYPFAEAQSVMKDIAAGTGGDNVSDKARILRLPGTKNHKTSPPKDVRLLRLDLLAPKHKLSDFYGYDREYASNGGMTFEDLTGPRYPRDSNTASPWTPSTNTAPKFGPGERNNGLTRLAGIMVAKGLDRGEVLEQLFHENTTRCDPPLGTEEVMTIAHSIERYRHE